MSEYPDFPSECPHGVPVRVFWVLRDYVHSRRDPGGFLKAVLSNDLMSAVCLGDKTNLDDIDVIARFVYCRLPGLSWGSKNKVDTWLAG